MAGEFARILREIDQAPGCEATKRRIKKILKSQSGKRIRIHDKPFVQRDRLHAAASLLRVGHTRAETTQALTERFGLSPSHAQRVTNAALDLLRPDRQGALFDD